MSRSVLVRGRRAWLRQIYCDRIRVSPALKRQLAKRRTYPREPLGDVIVRLVASWV